MTPKQVLEMVKKKNIKVVDIRFMDFPGVWQHFTVPTGELDESSFENGFGLMDRVFEAGSRFMPATCWWYPRPIPPR